MRNPFFSVPCVFFSDLLSEWRPIVRFSPLRLNPAPKLLLKEGNEEKEESPYGPWLLVSYGKQGNRNFNGRIGKYGSGNGRTVAKIGSEGNVYAVRNNLDGKADGNSSVRSPEGECSEVRSGNKTQSRYGRSVKNSEGIRIIDSGSRFDVLNMEMDSPRTEVTTSVGIPNEGTRLKVVTKVYDHQKGASRPSGCSVSRGSLQIHKAQTQDFGMEGLDNASVLRHLHTEIASIEVNSSRMVESISIQDNLNNQIVSNFDIVASGLTEAMAVVFE
ncbi:hypothetical protein Q3G72_017081 [Acer saccharum]|nr:hypothetical protein Q3G72_017081 [Acer saccharum]